MPNAGSKRRVDWGDRDFTAAGPPGVVYLTWDYGPSAALVTDVCSSGGNCAFATGDLNVVVQKSTDYGRTPPITGRSGPRRSG